MVSTTISSDICPKVIHYLATNATYAFEEALNGGSTAEADMILAKFNATDIRYDDFAYFYADVFAEMVQYAKRTELCEVMEQIVDLPFEDQLTEVAKLAV